MKENVIKAVDGAANDDAAEDKKTNAVSSFHLKQNNVHNNILKNFRILISYFTTGFILIDLNKYVTICVGFINLIYSAVYDYIIILYT